MPSPKKPTPKKPAAKPALSSGVKPTFFKSPVAFRAWLEKHHATKTELWVAYYKKHTGKQTIVWAEAVVEALCFGWIDGIAKSLGEDAHMNRFTPRKRTSIWSEVNVRSAQRLIAEGRMMPAGLAAFEARTENRTGVYAFEGKAAAFTAAEEQLFRQNKKAWSYWEAAPAGYKRTAMHWVMSAKREETRAKRLATLISDSEAGLRIAQLRR